jgi:hypothetical protein
MRMLRRLGLTLGILAATLPCAAAPGLVRGVVVDPEGLPLPGVSVVLMGPSNEVAASAVADATGAFLIDATPGTYTLRVELSGFAPTERAGITVTQEPVTLALTLSLAPYQEQVVVSAEPEHPVIGNAEQPDAPVTVTREVIDSAMLPNSQYDDALALMPNVVRGPDGSISIAGARAPQGALFVDGFNKTDPLSGTAPGMLPIDAVDSVDVYSGAYPARFDHATGGVTSVHTRSGSDQMHMTADSFFPRLLFTHGSIHGIEYWDPNMGVSGPIVRGRVFFEQALSYRSDRNRFTTLVGPETNKYTALMSWSQVDVRMSDGQHLMASVAVDPQSTDHASITAFAPAASVPRVNQRDWSAALGYDWTMRNSSLEVRGSFIKSHLSVAPDGSQIYTLGHDLVSGSYFDNQDFQADRITSSAVYTVSVRNDHLLRIGASAGRTSFSGTDTGAEVDLLRSDGTLSRSITFLGGSPLRSMNDEAGAFVQDTWNPRPWVTIESGIRVDQSTAAAGLMVSPRVGWIFRPAQTCTISGSIGLYGDKVLPAALAFPSQQARLVASYDASGTALGTPVLYKNAIDGPLSTPQATWWDIEANRTFGRSWLTRVKYQQRRGTDELVINPVATGPTTGLLLVSSGGASDSRSLEVTAGYRPPQARHEAYVSYVRAATRGDLNTFDAIDGTFREPFVQSNQVGPLPSDVPHRVLAWGVWHLPSRITVAPFVDLRSGFSYSAIDDTWTYVGARDGYRLPWFGSLDLYVNKIVSLSSRLPDVRVGLKLYNLASTHSARDVQRDIARPDFGTAYNPVPRDLTFVFEVMWNKK